MSQRPPGRASISQTGLVKWCGPHHCAICTESVHARQTRSRGASSTRVKVTSRVILSASVMTSPTNAGECRLFLGGGFQLGEAGLEVAADHLIHVEEHMDDLGEVRRRTGH